MLPLISVIIPVYKVENYLAKCVESVMAQTYSNLEIFLVDDGSPDRCGEICDEYARQDPRIKVIHKENGGLSDARNAAISQATGEYLTFIDSDDWIEPGYCAFLYQKLVEYSADVVVTPLRSVDEAGNIVARPFTEKESVMDATTAMRLMFARDNISWCAQAKLYKRELFEGVRYPVGWLMEDKATTYKIYDRCQRIVYADTPIYNYLIRTGSIMRSNLSDRHVAAFDIQLEINRFLEEKYPSVVETAYGYTARCAIGMICKMRASGYARGEKTQEMLNYCLRYKKELLRCDLIDFRYKMLIRVIAFLYSIKKENMYDSKSFGRVADFVSKRL